MLFFFWCVHPEKVVREVIELTELKQVRLATGDLYYTNNTDRLFREDFVFMDVTQSLLSPSRPTNRLIGQKKNKNK